MKLCDDVDAEAPRAECGCRSCCRARESRVDPRLLALVHTPVMATHVKPSRHVIWQVLVPYLAGAVSESDLHFVIIQALADQLDAAMERELTAIRLRPPVLREIG